MEDLASPPSLAVEEVFEICRKHGKGSVFVDKGLLDPSRLPKEIVGRSEQFESLVRYLVDLDHGYLPPLIQVYGPAGSGKTTTVLLVTDEASAQFPNLRVVYVNLKQCRSVYAVANRILASVTGSKEPPVSGLDGIFEKIWAATRDRAYLLLIFDEVDSVFEMWRYSPSDFIYRFVRHRDPGEPPIVGVITITNRLLGLESLFDSRVKSSIGSHSVFFGPYNRATLLEILQDRAAAFRTGTLDEKTLPECAKVAAEEHGDARQALDLLRVAGELADRSECPQVWPLHIWRAQYSVDHQRISRIVFALPDHEVAVLEALALIQTYGNLPVAAKEVVSAEELFEAYEFRCAFWGIEGRRRRRFLDFLDSLETSGLVESMVQSSGRHGRKRLVWMKADVSETRDIAYNCLRERHKPELVSSSADSSWDL